MATETVGEVGGGAFASLGGALIPAVWTIAASWAVAASLGLLHPASARAESSTTVRNRMAHLDHETVIRRYHGFVSWLEESFWALPLRYSSARGQGSRPC